MVYLEDLVTNGIFDVKTKRNLEVRVIFSLGDNLEQNQICGFLPNFSKMEFCCRKCYASRTILCTAENYGEIHSKSQIARTNESINEDFEEAERLGPLQTNVRGIAKRGLYFEFPHFDSAKMLPQCSAALTICLRAAAKCG